jgi:hypothetical protein
MVEVRRVARDSETESGQQGAQLPEPLAPNEVVGMRMRPEPVYLNAVIANRRRILAYPAERPRITLVWPERERPGAD